MTLMATMCNIDRQVKINALRRLFEVLQRKLQARAIGSAGLETKCERGKAMLEATMEEMF